ncbi:Diguanylate cyclase (GGDEF)-like protein OS=Ureibacillus acetophenoni OX=614649 GN=SAMN05877842_103222 PE=4 SV=1 [Ureibacillus acetophenoni]
MIPYILLILFNTIVYIITDIIKINISEQNMKSVDFFVSFYVLMSTFLGALITISDNVNYNQQMIYTLTLVITCSVFVLRIPQLITSVLLSSATLFIGLYLQNRSYLLKSFRTSE